MGTISTELLDQKRDARGRHMRTRQERESLLKVYEESGLPQLAFAKREGIKYTTFVSWVQAAKKQRAEGPVKFTQLTLPSPLKTQSVLEVHLPDGSIIRGADAGQIGELIRLLRC